MAHFARINEKNKVRDIIVIANEAITDENGNEQESLGLELIASLGMVGRWVQCSYNGSFRGIYPQLGFIYDSELDEFVAPIAESVEEDS